MKIEKANRNLTLCTEVTYRNIRYDLWSSLNLVLTRYEVWTILDLVCNEKEAWLSLLC